ncbi:MAG: four helix bundle protein, partial [Nitrospirae bacterium]|nr:four helix bundle protein [Nitrospirota bacterium]
MLKEWSGVGEESGGRGSVVSDRRVSEESNQRVEAKAAVRQRIEQVGDLLVYRTFLDLALEVEKVTRGFGPDFRWLRVQSLRSSESACANLPEGFYSQYSTEYLQALYRVRREARETMTHLDYGAKVNQLPETIVSGLLARYTDGLRQLGKLISSIEFKIAK